MTGPNKVEHVKKQVIEHKLLAALDDESKVAILCTEQDLKDLHAALCGYELADRTSENTLSWQAFTKRRKELADGCKQLLKEAFGVGV